MHNLPHSDAHSDELFDVQYDVCESLFERIRERMDCHKDDLAVLKIIRDHVIQAVAKIENVDPASVYRDLEDIRTENT